MIYDLKKELNSKDPTSIGPLHLLRNAEFSAEIKTSDITTPFVIHFCTQSEYNKLRLADFAECSSPCELNVVDPFKVNTKDESSDSNDENSNENSNGDENSNENNNNENNNNEDNNGVNKRENENSTDETNTYIYSPKIEDFDSYHLLIHQCLSVITNYNFVIKYTNPPGTQLSASLIPSIYIYRVLLVLWCLALLSWFVSYFRRIKNTSALHILLTLFPILKIISVASRIHAIDEVGKTGLWTIDYLSILTDAFSGFFLAFSVSLFSCGIFVKNGFELKEFFLAFFLGLCRLVTMILSEIFEGIQGYAMSMLSIGVLFVFLTFVYHYSNMSAQQLADSVPAAQTDAPPLNTENGKNFERFKMFISLKFLIVVWSLLAVIVVIMFVSSASYFKELVLGIGDIGFFLLLLTIVYPRREQVFYSSWN